MTEASLEVNHGGLAIGVDIFEVGLGNDFAPLSVQSGSMCARGALVTRQETACATRAGTDGGLDDVFGRGGWAPRLVRCAHGGRNGRKEERRKDQQIKLVEAPAK